MRLKLNSIASLSFFLLGILPAQAAPILNLNAPSAEGVTVYPDHDDVNLFYLVPSSMRLAYEPNGTPRFSYQEIRYGWTTKAAVQSLMVPAYQTADIDAVKARILVTNPSAKFTALPFIGSNMSIGSNILAKLVETVDCAHKSGVIGQEQACSFLLTSMGRKVMRKMFREGLTITLQLGYTVQGVIQDAKGDYVNQTLSFQMAGALGGKELAKFPELFRDSSGHAIGVDDESPHGVSGDW